MDEVTALLAARNGLANLSALPEEPTLVQTRVIRPPVRAILDLPRRCWPSASTP